MKVFAIVVVASLATAQVQFIDEPIRFNDATNDFDYEEPGVFEPLNLPSGASFLLGDISPAFSCADRPYGYYADVDNYCRVFHICNPSLFEDGTVQTYQYSFMCNAGSIFDQNALTCVREFSATPCEYAP
ncbi:unnamed protein product, partial [Meganyctiphanes norvegica]